MLVTDVSTISAIAIFRVSSSDGVYTSGCGFWLVSFVTNNSLSEDYSDPDNRTRQTSDTPGFKPFTSNNNKVI